MRLESGDASRDGRTSDAVSRFNQLIDNFHQERATLAEYENLVAPKHASLHALQWNER